MEAFDLTHVLYQILSNVPVWAIIGIFAHYLFKKTSAYFKQLEKRLDDLDDSVSEIKFELIGAHLKETPKKLEIMQKRSIELAADMQAVWDALERMNSNARERKPRGHDS
jgi:hypothetical protein